MGALEPYFTLGLAQHLSETQAVYAHGFPLGLSTPTKQDQPENSDREGAVSIIA